jgi:hypothetical protein
MKFAFYPLSQFKLTSAIRLEIYFGAAYLYLYIEKFIFRLFIPSFLYFELTIMNTFTGIQIEGNLITFDLTTELLSNELKGQTPKDFGIAQTNKLEDEIAIAWGDAKTYWAAFQRRLAKLAEDETATSLTREYWAVPLLESLGYKPEYQPKAEIVEGQTFAISHRAEAGEARKAVAGVPPVEGTRSLERWCRTGFTAIRNGLFTASQESEFKRQNC